MCTCVCLCACVCTFVCAYVRVCACVRACRYILYFVNAYILCLVNATTSGQRFKGKLYHTVCQTAVQKGLLTSSVCGN